MKKHVFAIILIATGISGLMILDFLSSSGYSIQSADFNSNGERIYFTATSNSGSPIIASTGQITMHSGMMSCALCHGPDGKGGAGRMMMWSFEAPDIRYSSLAAGHDEEQPYTDDQIKRAITKGIDSSGKRLEPPMPVWQMSETDLNDLIKVSKNPEIKLAAQGRWTGRLIHPPCNLFRRRYTLKQLIALSTLPYL